MAWKSKAVTLLSGVITSGPHHTSITQLNLLDVPIDVLAIGLPLLRGIRDDFDKGFLVDLGIMVEAEIASDYMGQAESLMNEGQSGKFDHVPAAVLAGAVLERSLRTLCGQGHSIPPEKSARPRATGHPHNARPRCVPRHRLVRNVLGFGGRHHSHRPVTNQTGGTEG
jgi:hypothetical protein